MKNKRLFLLAIMLINSLFIASSQTVKILNINNLEPISEVLVFNQGENVHLLSNNRGQIDISEFNLSDTLYFQHTGYKTRRAIVTELRKTPTIFLSESVVRLSEILIAANKWEQKREEISHKINVIEKKDVIFQNPQTTADLLEASGEVYVQKSQLGGGSPMLRGFATNSVLLVIDGVRLNNAIYRQGNLQNIITLDVNIIDESEILFGPGSVIYGSDALGGVMDFHTRRPLLSSNEKILFKTNNLLRYSSANNENTIHSDFIIGGKKISSVTSFTYSKYGDLKMGTNGNNNPQYVRENYVKQINGIDSIVENTNKNIQKFSGYKQINLMQKIRYKPNDLLDLIYSFHFSKSSNIPRYDALRQKKKNSFKFAEWNYGPQIWQLHSLKSIFKRKNIFFDEFKTILAYQHYQESRITRKFNKSNQITQAEKVNILSLNLDFHKEINNKFRIFYGSEWIFNKLDSKAKTKDIKKNEELSNWTLPRYPDGKNHYHSFALYTTARFKPTKKIVLNAGIRYSYVFLNSTFENEYYKIFNFNSTFTNKNSAINGSLGLGYQWSENSQWNVHLSSGFQSPNWDGLGKVFTPKKGVIIVPNPKLKPQYAYSFETGIIQYLFKKSVKIDLSAFYTIVNQPIVQRKFLLNNKDSLLYDKEMNAIEAFVNAKNGSIYGVNFALFANLSKNFGLKTFLTYTHGTDNEGNRLRHIPPLFGSSHFIFQIPKFKADFYGIYHAKVSSLPNSEKGKDYMYAINKEGKLFSPSWYTLNLKFTYTFLKTMQLNFGIENLFDARYRPYSSGIVANGRNFIVALYFII